jgi:hypothetical protein
MIRPGDVPGRIALRPLPLSGNVEHRGFLLDP